MGCVAEKPKRPRNYLAQIGLSSLGPHTRKSQLSRFQQRARGLFLSSPSRELRQGSDGESPLSTLSFCFLFAYISGFWRHSYINVLD
jgi:hypothetical protein